jgi:polyisoprenoid-binding protein YceI
MTTLSGEYVLDTGRTRIGFVARHRMATRVRGRFAAFEGEVRLDGGDSSARLTIRADSIDTGARRRDAQLRKDFLGTAAYPAITFISTKVSQVSSAAFDVTGDLTIRGTTRSVTVPFELTESGGDVRFTASLTIDRHTWKVNWNAFTTALVDANVVLELDAVVTPYSQPTPS